MIIFNVFLLVNDILINNILFLKKNAVVIEL